MNPYALSMIVSSLALGTILTLSSYHWILAWIGLEINTLAIIPMMTKTPHPRAIEAATKYFLTQAAASALILFSSILNAYILGEWAINTPTHPIPATLLSIAIAMKLGVAPFHFWFPEVLQGSTLQTGLILSTWQKLAPMALLLQLSQSVNLNLMLTLGLLSTMIGGWGGINQTQIRKILAFSSVAHLGWMVAILKISPQLTLMNFSLYILMTSTLFMTFMTLNTKNMYELSTTWSKTPALTALSMLSLLSLSGLPPLTGFLPKWFIAQEMIKQDMIMFALVILLSTLLSLFFYLRLTYSMSLTLAPSLSSSSSLWFSPPKNTLATPMILSLLLLPVAPTIMAMI
uniref:NADH-ubiquinone oxidoreductase chain 2 n=1 Tax=Strauchbufo raddei TaxID=103435 RepID=A0A0U2HWT2_9NEOB|nr:NADH dehydrogenase subunit 2 [Strauchbufo raddei]ALL53105.1 NADH dehydrogenase subunit 2 [Strauchbufo raddei]ALP29930.1 NADH dehydrogenase subunit 1 [Strauchbufo raddei]WMW23603.1 NADH dehydrogenase subunit 2 [Strauchbufo raddei]